MKSGFFYCFANILHVKLTFVPQTILKMDINDILVYCSEKPGAEETFPFDASTLVLKVCGKMFALIGLDSLPLSINLKCDPEWAVKLRNEYAEITPGYHMNKKHWNTVIIDEGNLSNELIFRMIDHSYHLVVDTLSKSKRSLLDNIQK